MTILDKLADHARERVAAAKETVSAQEIKERALALPKGEFEFEAAIRRNPDIAFICECRRGLHFCSDRAEVVSRQQ